MKKIVLMMILLLSACANSQTMTKEEIFSYIKEEYILNDHSQIIEKEYASIYVVLYDACYSVFVKQDSQKYEEVIVGKIDEDVKKESVEGYDIYISLNEHSYYAYELYDNCDAVKQAVNPTDPFIVITSEGGNVSWIN